MDEACSILQVNGSVAAQLGIAQRQHRQLITSVTTSHCVPSAPSSSATIMKDTMPVLLMSTCSQHGITHTPYCMCTAKRLSLMPRDLLHAYLFMWHHKCSDGSIQQNSTVNGSRDAITALNIKDKPIATSSNSCWAFQALPLTIHWDLALQQQPASMRNLACESWRQSAQKAGEGLTWDSV